MGMYDSVFDETLCRCGVPLLIEVQFKSGECLLQNYYPGDFILSASPGIHIISGHEDNCYECGLDLHFHAIIKDRQFIKIVSDEELLLVNFFTLPTLEEGHYRKEKYKLSCQIGFGTAQEFSDFSIHPLRPNTTIEALSHEWTILESFRKTINSSHVNRAILQLKGSLNRRSSTGYVYKVKHETLGIRWIEVSDRTHENMELFQSYPFQEGYLFTSF